MSVINVLIRGSGAAAAVACLLCSSAFAQPPEGPKESRGCGSEWRGPPRPPPMGPGFGAEDRPPPYLMGLHLSEDQDDKVFGILHAAAPEMRERAKAARKARDALREMGQSAQYDAGKTASLAQALGAAENQLALLRARADHEIYLLLTPDQRTRIAEGAHDDRFHGPEGPPHGADGPVPR
jgi:protein CpxP